MLEVDHADAALARLETDRDFTAGYAPAVVKNFRRCMQQIRLVSHAGQLQQFRGRRFKQLKGDRKHQHSLRLTKKWRLIVELGESTGPDQKIMIVEIENHYGD